MAAHSNTKNKGHRVQQKVKKQLLSWMYMWKKWA